MHMEMNQRNLQLLQADAALAGTDDALRQRLSRLAQRRITPEKELPPMDFLFNLFDVPCFPRGELVGLTGRAKSGKTFVTSMLMAEAAALQSSFNGGSIRIPQLRRRRQSPLRVLWLDTEQSEESTQDILRHRLLPMAGEGATAFLDVFNVRGECWQERLPLLEAAVTELLPDLVILDGIRDLVNDINDGVLAQEVIERLMHLAQEHQCCIVSVLHRNKSAEDRSLRGWIGTELTNKAFEVYGCEKADGRVFALEQLHTRKHDIFDTLRFTVGDGGLPVAIGWNSVPSASRPAVSVPRSVVQSSISQPIAAETNTADVATSAASVSETSDTHRNVKVFGVTCRATSTLPTINPHYVVRYDDGRWDMNVQLLFNDALRNGIVRHAELIGWMRNEAGLANTHYCLALIKRAIAERIALKSRDHVGQVIYALPPQQPLDLFDSS